MDEGVDDASFLAFAAAAERTVTPQPPHSIASTTTASTTTTTTTQAASSKQPTPTSTKITQPTPQPLPKRSTATALLVSPRQKGNPLLPHIHALPWEFVDTPADYVLSATSCALFLSLKYHRLHPEYLYARLASLGRQRFELRVLLALVDVDAHEESLRELAATALAHDCALVLAWSAREAAHYLQAYRLLAQASSAPIRGGRAAGYAERVVEFVTQPRGVNKADAMGLVGAFGSLRAAVNARPEVLAGVQGWGEVKVRRWCGVVREGFRVGKKREKGEGGVGVGVVPLGRAPNMRREESAGERGRVTAVRSVDGVERTGNVRVWEPGDEEEEALMQTVAGEEGGAKSSEWSEATRETPPKKKPRVQEPELSESMKAALAKYRS